MKKTIHIVKHKLTGAKIPMHIRDVDDNNTITEYKEHLQGRKGFKIDMLVERWGMPKEECIKLLKKYQIPGHLNSGDRNLLQEGTFPVDLAIFFEEYIYGLENKEELQHTKLKARNFIVKGVKNDEF